MLEKEAIIKKLQDYFAQKQEVEFAYLFGSIARDEANKLSDIDIAVMCKGKCSILRMMSEIARELQFDEIDIVDLKQTKNLRLLKSIIQEGIVVKDAQKRWDWELHKYHLALDFLNHARVVYGY